MTHYLYRPDVLAQLARHGVRPTPATPPERVHELLGDLYRYELRRLRDALVRGAIARAGYADRVIALRRKYALVSLRPSAWLVTE